MLVVDPGEVKALDAWRELRGLVDITGRYPLLLEMFDVELSFLEQQPTDAWTLSQDGYGETFASAMTLDLEHLEPYRSNYQIDYLNCPLDHPGHPLGETLRRFGANPTTDEVRSLYDKGQLRSDEDFQRWLLRWELQHFGEAAIAPRSLAHLQWDPVYESDVCVIAMPPTPFMWEASAFIPLFGDNNLPSGLDFNTASLRAWALKYKAEMVIAHGTTRYLTVGSRPSTLEEAFSLAVHHMRFASDTLVLPGVSLREHARALYASDRWFFHSKS
jgi:Domain of unknown function (DUF4253)